MSAAFIQELSATVARTFGRDIQLAFHNYALLVTKLAGAGINAYAGGAIANLFTLAAKSALPNKQQTLSDLKQTLANKLKMVHPRRILVVIDDLDRLTPSEATEMVGLVKNLGDLPNVVYLLSYDETNLAAQLKTTLGIDDGYEYLQKIVQVSFSLPRLKLSKITQLLLEKVASVEGLFGGSDNQRLSTSVSMHVISHYFSSPRDVAKFAGTFLFVHASLKEKTDPTDLFILTVAQVLDPELYEWISEFLPDLTSGSSGIESAPYHYSSEEGKFTKLKENASFEWENGRENIVSFLFPDAQESFSKFISSVQRAGTHRIHDIEHAFDYFHLSEQLTTWSRSVLAEIKNQSDPSDVFGQMQTFISNQPVKERSNLRVQFISYLNSWLKTELTFDKKWMEAILENGPSLIRAKDDNFFSDNLRRLTDILKYGIGDDTKKRELYIEQALKNKTDFSLPAVLLWRAIGGVNEQIYEEYDSKPYINNRAPELRKKFITRVENLYASGDLWKQADPSGITYAWNAMLEDGIPDGKFNNDLESDASLEILFDLPINKSSSGNFIKVKTFRFYDLAKAKKKAKTIAKQKSSSLQKSAQRFLDAYVEGEKPQNQH